MKYTECGRLQSYFHSRLIFIRDFSVLGSDFDEKRRAEIANDSIQLLEQMKKEECGMYTNHTAFFEELQKEIESTLFAKITTEEIEIIIAEVEKRESKSEWISFSTRRKKEEK